MPGGDGTGPGGMGSMTGRGAGFCAGYAMPGFANPVAGWGYRPGRGGGRGGRGRRNRFYATGLTGWQRTAYGYPAQGVYGSGVPNYGLPYNAPAGPTREQELDMLKGQAEYLEDALEGINKRIGELGSEKKSAEKK